MGQFLLLGACAVLLALGVLVIGIAVAVVARRAVRDLLAGAGLRLAQAYRAGQRVQVPVASPGPVEEAEVVRVGPASTTLMTRNGIVVVPNNRMLHAAQRPHERPGSGKTITRA